jgi:hypothetical protein
MLDIVPECERLLFYGRHHGFQLVPLLGQFLFQNLCLQRGSEGVGLQQRVQELDRSLRPYVAK